MSNCVFCGEGAMMGCHICNTLICYDCARINPEDMARSEDSENIICQVCKDKIIKIRGSYK